MALANRTPPNLEGCYTAKMMNFHISFRIFFYTDGHTDTSPSSGARRVHQRLCTLNKGSRQNAVLALIFTREMRMRKSLVRIRHSGCRRFSWHRPTSARSIPLDSWPRRRRFLTCCCSCPRGPRLAEAAPGASRRRSACQGGSAATQKTKKCH